MVAVVQSRPASGHVATVHVATPSRSVAAGRPAGARAVSGRTYRRRRAGAVAVAVTVVVAVQGLLGMHHAAVSPPSPVPLAAERLSTYVVQPGDTFWSIARRLRPDGDPRPLVDRLVAEHGSAVLHVGERIALPERR